MTNKKEKDKPAETEERKKKENKPGSESTKRELDRFSPKSWWEKRRGRT